MRTLLIVCLLTRIAFADRQQLAEGTNCVRESAGVRAQLVGERLFLMRDDGFEENALWVIALGDSLKAVHRVGFAQMSAQSFLVEGDRLYVHGSLPGQPPRVLVLDANNLSLMPDETAAGWPACTAAGPLPPPELEVRGNDITVIPTTVADPDGPRGFMFVLRDGILAGQLDADTLVDENYRAVCREIYRSRPADCARRGTATFEYMAFIAGNRLLSVGSAGVAVHDLGSLRPAGGLSLSALRAMSPTIVLK